MQNIFDIHDYDEHFIDQFTSQTLPIFDRWMIKPLQNEKKILDSGSSDEADKFIDFMNEHVEKDSPIPLLIVVGLTEKNNPTKMLNSTLQYHKLKFDKFKGNDIGTPLQFGYSQSNQNNNQMMPLQMMGFGKKPPFNQSGMNGISYTEIQGIIDKNVSDATRSIRAEYEEVSAKREAESIKRLAELEMKMELYKLDLRAKEVEEKERKLQEELDNFEVEKAEGLGTVKDYTKTIASGLLELGKTAFGIEDKDDKKESSKSKSSSDKSKKDNNNLKGTQTTSIDGDDFTEKTDQASTTEENNHKESFKDLKEILGDLSPEEKLEMIEILIPEEELSDNDNTSEETPKPKKKTKTNNKTKTKKNEDIQSDNND